ncbi:MAG: dihydroorotate dehydrogenase electron transfer subunit [Proteobacteria bacterium]|nr:dihydroorotate dehydrogenase electron transfer subunit [Pseudomonadota bacterium]TDJ38566.1 MAG: dihydroorotate dehydrogenase electron transfer subunit [Gammaproteobacteria bacterium]
MATKKAQKNRGTLFVEDAEVIAVKSFPGEQFITRLTAPKCAEHAAAGSFVHIQCDESMPMRRPLSIMRTDADEGWIEVLYKVVGEGLRALASKKTGDMLSVIGPIGYGFTPSPERPKSLLIGGGVGIPPMVFLAEALTGSDATWQPLVLMGSEIPFPFQLTNSEIASKWLPDEISSTMPLLEEWQVPARLASLSDFAGVYRGYVTDLACEWLSSLDQDELAQTEVFACGPTAMLKAVADMARQYDVPCQVSLEEFMACAVGGCAGCTVLVQTDDGPAMKRVCVDGPVFDAATVFPVA